MKVGKFELLNEIEEIVAEGVMNGEEVDITSSKIIKQVWPIIQYYKERYEYMIEPKQTEDKE